MTDASLAGKHGLIVGVANQHSIATGCARALRDAGAEIALTYLSERARPFVEPVAEEIGAAMLLPLDVEADGQMEAVFAAIARDWGKLDFLINSIAFCPKDDLHGRVTDCSKAGFAQVMDISVHSLIRMVRKAKPLMANGGAILTMSYYGAEKVVDHYSIMGPVKSALEGVERCMATKLGPKGIRVNALSPGPLNTRAASGIDHFDALVEETRQRAHEHKLVSIADVGAMAAFLISDRATRVDGDIVHVDAGYHVMA